MDILKKHGLSFYKTVSEKEGEDFEIAKELIENLFCDMAKLSTKYVWDLPYTYRERQLDSILLPTLSKLCRGQVITELPAYRICNNRRFQVDESSGRIDYWCIYKNYSFVIELKHGYDFFSTPTTQGRVTARWIKMQEQLQSIEKEIKSYVEETKGIIRIGLFVVTSRSEKSPNNTLIKNFKKSISETFERFQKDLGRGFPTLKPDLQLCWRIPSTIVMREEQTFPGLWAISKIYPAKKHVGAKQYDNVNY